MSGTLDKEFNELASKLTVPAPKYTLDTNRTSNERIEFVLGGGVELPEEHHDHILAPFVKQKADLSYDEDSGKLVVRCHHNHIRDSIVDDILGFLSTHLPNPNPRLTKIYRYYRDNYITDDKYGVWKYIKTYNRSDPRHEKNILALLKLLMEREA